LEQFTDGLVEEGLKDAAETFFGARRDLEKEIERFESRVEELRRVYQRLSLRYATLSGLLGDREALKRFWQTLGVFGPGSEVPEPAPDGEAEPIAVPWGITRASRYAKTVYRTYERLERVVREYMDGVYKKDPETPGRKVKTVHYNGMLQWSLELNRKIARVNRLHSPSEAMQFAKRLDAGAQMRENVAGAPMRYTMDRDMSFSPVDFDAAGLPRWPELPRAIAVRKVILRFAEQHCREAPNRARQALRNTVSRKQ
jgi:hypothetical protein